MQGMVTLRCVCVELIASVSMRHTDHKYSEHDYLTPKLIFAQMVKFHRVYETRSFIAVGPYLKKWFNRVHAASSTAWSSKLPFSFSFSSTIWYTCASYLSHVCRSSLYDFRHVPLIFCHVQIYTTAFRSDMTSVYVLHMFINMFLDKVQKYERNQRILIE